MDIKEFAEKLNGCMRGLELTIEAEQEAKVLGYVIVFAYSDDNMEFRGAINEEVGCYDGGTAYLTKTGLFDPYDNECESECKYYQQAKDLCKTITAVWCGNKGYTWHYETDIPHEAFDIFEDDEKFCQGIVFDIKSLA